MAQFLVIKYQYDFGKYRSGCERAVIEMSGMRTHDVHIDQILAGGVLPYQAITVDFFPCGEDALNAFKKIIAERQAAISEAYALLVRPRAGLPRIDRALGYFAHLLSRWLGTNREKEMVGFAVHANPGTGPTPETVEVMRQHDQSTPFNMIDLNEYYSRARYRNGEDVSDEQAYNRSANRITPILVSVGCYRQSLAQLSVFSSEMRKAGCMMIGVFLRWFSIRSGGISSA